MVLLDIPDIPRNKTEAEQPSDIGQQKADLFAQIGSKQQTKTMHSCDAAHTRMKADLVDFYGQDELFTDTEFPTDDALYWADMFSQNFGQMSQLKDRITWVRASTRFPENSLWGTDGITPMDVR